MNKPEKTIDVLIIGAGVAGLTAGIYAARMKLPTLILEDELVGGQIKDAYVVENYPGFDQIKGSDLTERMQEQALRAGVTLDEFDRIVAVQLTDQPKIVETETTIYRPTVIIISAGMRRRELPVPQEGKLRGRGIHYCQLCDGHLYNGKTVAVVGGGNGAVGAANFLDKYAKQIYLIQQLPNLTADDQTARAKLFHNPKITVLPNVKVLAAIGDQVLTALTLENLATGAITELPLDGVFVQIGSTPNSALYKGQITLDDFGYIVADETCVTNVPGVYAAGDIRTKAFRQLTTAVSDGTVAALQAEKYLQSLKK
ncbi:MAG: FAD-dependent oxidoreductase [Bacillota bacterium]|jgi:thioredoxin reductase (NADPH)